MKAKKSNKKSEWKEVDPQAIIKADAEIVLKTIYQVTTKTASQLAEEAKMDLSLAQKALDYLVKEGKIRRIDNPPYNNEPVYTSLNENMQRVDCMPLIKVAAGVVWHCLGKHGMLTHKGIEEETGLDIQFIGMAIGMLAYEGKLRMFENTKTKEDAFCLTDAEQKIFNKHKKPKQKLDSGNIYVSLK
jgi:ribosomal protein S25